MESHIRNSLKAVNINFFGYMATTNSQMSGKSDETDLATIDSHMGPSVTQTSGKSDETDQASIGRRMGSNVAQT